MIFAEIFSVGELIFLIPILGIIVGGISVWAKHQQKMKEIEVQAREKGLPANKDISRELSEAIQQEFARLRADNEALRASVAAIQAQQTQAQTQLSNTQLTEIAKQVQAMQTHS